MDFSPRRLIGIGEESLDSQYTVVRCSLEAYATFRNLLPDRYLFDSISRIQLKIPENGVGVPHKPCRCMLSMVFVDDNPLTGSFDFGDADHVPWCADHLASLNPSVAPSSSKAWQRPAESSNAFTSTRVRRTDRASLACAPWPKSSNISCLRRELYLLHPCLGLCFHTAVKSTQYGYEFTEETFPGENVEAWEVLNGNHVRSLYVLLKARRLLARPTLNT